MKINTRIETMCRREGVSYGDVTLLMVVTLLLIKLSDGLDLFEKLRETEECLYKENKPNSVGLLGGEDKYLNTSQLLRKYGYRAEEYFVITEDGYNLTLVRARGEGPVVFVMHGLLSSSDDFLTSGPNRSLVYLLLNEGYDVWLGNARGSKYSKRHVTLSPEEKAFWQFSWHEIGYYDLPAMIDEALRVSEHTQMTYIGHSQGTTVFYVMASLKPEYNNKIRLSISLAPIAWIWHFKPAFARALVPFRNDIYAFATALRIYEALPDSPATKLVTSVLCNTSKLSLLICITALFTVFGFDYNQLDFNTLPVQVSHVPSGASLLQVLHYAQLVKSRTFSQFDYGTEENLNRYGTRDPPMYPVGNISSAAAFFYGDNDFVSVLDDVQILAERLPRLLGVYRVPHNHFNHFDHIWAKNGPILLYNKLLKMIRYRNMFVQ